MPKTVVTKTDYVVNDSTITSWTVDGHSFHIPIGKTLLSDLELPEGVNSTVTVKSAINHVIRRSIKRTDNGTVQQIKLIVEREESELPITKRDLSADELNLIKLELREEVSRELRDHVQALEAKRDKLQEQIDELENGLSSN